MAFHPLCSSWKTESRLVEECHHVCLIPCSSSGLCPCPIPLCSQQLIVCLWAPHPQFLRVHGTPQVDNWLGREVARPEQQHKFHPCSEHGFLSVKHMLDIAGNGDPFQDFEHCWTLMHSQNSNQSHLGPSVVSQNLWHFSMTQRNTLWTGKVKEVAFGFVYLFLFKSAFIL